MTRFKQTIFGLKFFLVVHRRGVHWPHAPRSQRSFQHLVHTETHGDRTSIPSALCCERHQSTTFFLAATSGAHTTTGWGFIDLPQLRQQRPRSWPSQDTPAPAILRFRRQRCFGCGDTALREASGALQEHRERVSRFVSDRCVHPTPSLGQHQQQSIPSTIPSGATSPKRDGCDNLTVSHVRPREAARHCASAGWPPLA